MALIPKFHVLAPSYPVLASGSDIVAGMWVKLDTATGEAELATGASGEIVIGVAGDTKSTSTSGLPSTNDARIGATNPDGTPVAAAFQNRVSDSFDETKASGMITVYQGNGVFATNEYETGTGIAVNSPLYVSGNGKATGTPSASAQIVAYCTKAPGAYESGVPGTDIRGSMSLGTYLEFKMIV